MKKDELQVLQDVTLLQEHEELLLRPSMTAQQSFLHNYLHLHLLKNRVIHDTLPQFLQKDHGSFSRLLLKLAYMVACLEVKYELNADQFPALHILQKWVTHHQHFATVPFVPINKAIFSQAFIGTYQGDFQEIMVFLDFTSKQILKLVQKNQNGQQYPFHQELSYFLSNILPHTYFNVIIEAKLIGESKQALVEKLYINEPILHMGATCKGYQHLVKNIFVILLSLQLKPKSQQLLLQSAMKYFYLFYPDPQSRANDIVMKVLSKVTEAVKFSVSDQMLIFLRILQSLQQTKLLSQMEQRSEWVRAMLQKISTTQQQVGNSLVGFASSLPLGETVTVGSSKREERFVEVFHDNSLLVYAFRVANHDINIALYYLGQFESKLETKKLLVPMDKVSGEVKNALVVKKRGIYKFEFDNSYSWFNAKSVKYQTSVLSPHSKIGERPLWMEYLFGEKEYQYKGSRVEQGKSREKKVAEDINKSNGSSKKNNTNDNSNKNSSTDSSNKNNGTANNNNNKNNSSTTKNKNSKKEQQKVSLLLIKGVFNMKIKKGTHLYEFETSDEKKILQKINQYIKDDSDTIIQVNQAANQFLDNIQNVKNKDEKQIKIKSQKQEEREQKQITPKKQNSENNQKRGQIKQSTPNKKVPPIQMQPKSAKSTIPPPPPQKSRITQQTSNNKVNEEISVTEQRERRNVPPPPQFKSMNNVSVNKMDSSIEGKNETSFQSNKSNRSRRRLQGEASKRFQNSFDGQDK